MESSKVPFIAEYDPYLKTRPLKQWRLRSTSPWMLSLFLAATGICFGLLLAINLIEKQTSTVTKRDVNSYGYNLDNLHEPRALLKRQLASTCTDYTIASVTVCLPVAGYVCSPDVTIDPATATSDPCATTITIVETASYLSLVTQDAEPQCTVTVGPNAATTASATGSCTTVTEYLTASTSASAYLSLGTQCTDTVIETVTTCPSLSGFVCPSITPIATAAATTGSCSTTTLFSTIVEFGTYYPPTSQCTDTVTELTTVCSPLSDYVCPIVTPPAIAVAASTGSCSTTTSTQTITTVGSYVPPTTECTITITDFSTVCSPPDGYVCASATPSVAASAAVTGLCGTSTLTETVTNFGYLPSTTPSSIVSVSLSAGGTAFSLDTQSPPLSTTEFSSASVSVSATPSSLTEQSPTPTVASSPSPPVSPLYSATSSSLTDQVSTTSTMGVIPPPADPSFLVGPTPTETSTTFNITSWLLSQWSTETIPEVIIVTTPFSLVDQASTSSVTLTISSPITYFTMVQLSSVPTDQTSMSLIMSPSSNGNPSQPSKTPEVSSTALAPFITPTVTTTSATASQGPTENLSMSPGDRTVITTDGATYLLIASTDGIYSSMYTEQITASIASTTMSLKTSTNTASTSTPTSFTLDQNFVLIKVHTFLPYYYFLAMYLPKIVAVIMTTLWTIIFAGLKLMEPFYQLSASTGAFASESMFGNYLASHISTSSLSSMFSGRWVLLLAGTISITWAAIVALISESMVVVAQGTCTNLNDPGSKPYYCDPGWAVNELILKIVMALTGFVFVLTFIILLIIMCRRRTGVYHDPSSIAAMAELLGNPLVMEDLQAIKPSSNNQEVQLLLGDNRYKIGLYDPVTGKDALFSQSQQHDLRWGLIKLEYTSMAQTINDRRLIGYNAIPNPSIVSNEEQKANRKRRIFQLSYDVIMFLTAMCVFGLVLGYWLDAKSDPLNDFFNSNTFGPRFVLTCLCIILSVGWRSTSQETTVMAPYRAMAKAYEAQSGVVAGRSILAPIAHTPWTAVYKGLRLRYLMVSMVAMCAVLADLLLIAVSGVPYRQSQIHLSLKVSVFTSLSILGIMILMSLVVIIYNRMSAGGTRKLPRSPNTLIGVWLYLCHGKLVNQGTSTLDESTSPLNSDELVAKYEGYQYGFTRNIGMDRVSRWTIDKVFDLRHWTFPTTTHRPPVVKIGQRGPQPIINTDQRGTQPFEASATPVDDSFGETRQGRFIQRIVSRRKPNTSPYGFPYFEAQAKSPVAQAPPARFEELRQRPQAQAPTRFEEVRPIPHPQSQPQPAPSPFEELRPRGQPQPPPTQFEDLRTPNRLQPQPHPDLYPPIVRLTPSPNIPPIRRQEPVPTIHEALASWEYEQEFYDPRRMSAGSLLGEGRRTGDGRNQYRRVGF